jgi:hypothetical protein
MKKLLANWKEILNEDIWKHSGPNKLLIENTFSKFEERKI